MKFPLLFATCAVLLHADTPNAPDARMGLWEKRSSFMEGRIFHSAVWTYSEMIIWGGGSEHQFYDSGGMYDPQTDRWREVTKDGAPSARWCHAAVWTGNEMIVWGGRASFGASEHRNDGGIFNPATNTWRAMSSAGAPTARSQMAAVWTGSELIVWGGISDGGECLKSGGSYNPRTDTWSALPTENAPEARTEPACVWTGSELIVWGGLLPQGNAACGTGGRYDPESKTWKPLSTAGAPEAARGMEAAWTGTEMIIWGGSHIEGDPLVNVGTNTGGRYNPRTDEWKPMSVTDAPDGRMYFSMAWTGEDLFVWGGGDQRKGLMTTGAIYTPETDEWRPVATVGAPSGRSILTTVWTGDRALIYGGSTGGSSAFNETHAFRPARR